MGKKGCIISVLILMTTAGCAHKPFDDWSTADTVRQVAFVAILAADAYQTHRIVQSDQFEEINPMIGNQVNLYMGACAVAHTVVSGLLKPGRWRTGWQSLWIGAEAVTVAHNYKIGVR